MICKFTGIPECEANGRRSCSESELLLLHSWNLKRKLNWFRQQEKKAIVENDQTLFRAMQSKRNANRKVLCEINNILDKFDPVVYILSRETCGNKLSDRREKKV